MDEVSLCVEKQKKHEKCNEGTVRRLCKICNNIKNKAKPCLCGGVRCIKAGIEFLDKNMKERKTEEGFTDTVDIYLSIC